jgi:hypothetical protein
MKEEVVARIYIKKFLLYQNTSSKNYIGFVQTETITREACKTVESTSRTFTSC